ncbi:MAG: polymer-forming cytoskeletal protein [Bacteroidia bacterium]|nr:polymer-forming cytoskeletal protein [Bacteroidia bacterium]MCF8427220.1 polymer-forming cytoskeletal protein [Bacteroidia bacterium]MCF8446418.1 polymer-forming cytoskeletal protein [Bacteroidia bacterium]
MAIFNQSKNTTFNPQEINILNAGTKINGDLISEGDLRVDGSLKGNIEVKAKLVLGVSAQVEGNVRAINCDISGVVKGNISVSDLLTIKSTAKINGDISCSKLIIEVGAEFNGRSTMANNLSNVFSDINTGKNSKPLDTKAPVISEKHGEKAAV